MQVLDLFCGCGGMSAGFASVDGFELVGALDLDRHACASFEDNLGFAPVRRDAQELLDRAALDEQIEAWGLDHTAPTVLIGCPPCQGFSSHRKKDPRVDGRNTLMGVFARVAAMLQPAVVVMENVPEMLRDKHWAHYADWRSTLVDAGYTVRTRIVNMARYGVPQERFRAVAIAARRHFDFPAETHSPEDYRTVRDAIGGLPSLESGQTDPGDSMHRTSRHRASTLSLIRQIPPDGGSRSALSKGLDCHDRVDGFRDVYGRLWWDRPAVAITARCRTPSCGRFTHPEQHRGLSVREAALLQGFPADYRFSGPFDEKFRQVGNAVPPRFASVLAEHIAGGLRVGIGQDGQDIVEPMRGSFSSRIAGLKRRAG